MTFLSSYFGCQVLLWNMELPTNPWLPTNPYVIRNLLPTEYTNISFYRLMHRITTTRTYLHRLGY